VVQRIAQSTLVVNHVANYIPHASMIRNVVMANIGKPVAKSLGVAKLYCKVVAAVIIVIG